MQKEENFAYNHIKAYHSLEPFGIIILTLASLKNGKDVTATKLTLCTQAKITYADLPELVSI